MSLNEAPVNPAIMAKVHDQLRKRLDTNKHLVKVLPDNIPDHTIQAFHNEYWTLKKQSGKEWIYITIGNLYYPQINGNYHTQIIVGVPPSLYKNDKYKTIQKKLQETDPDRIDYMLQQVIGRSLSIYSHSEGLVVRDPANVMKQAIKRSLELVMKARELGGKKEEIIETVSNACDEYQNQFGY